MDEADAVRPTPLHGASDVLVDGMARQFRDAYAVELVGLRSVLIIGGGRSAGHTHMIDRALADAVRGGRGTTRAPWDPSSHVNPMYVRDVGAMFAATTLHGRPFTLPVYDTGSGHYSASETCSMPSARFCPLHRR